jgi:hypothetical protein
MAQFTVLIITHGIEEHLKNSLGSLGVLDPDHKIIIIANGCKLSCPIPENARLIETDHRLAQGKVLNLGLAEVDTEWIFFLGEGSGLSRQYGEIIHPLLSDPKIEGVGGPALMAKEMSFWARSLSLALSSPFCSGATFARYQSLGQKMVLADEEKLSDLNLWLRKSLLDQEGFPEEFKKGSEILLLQKLKAQGAHLLYHPKLKVFNVQLNRASDFFWEGYFRSLIMRRKLCAGQEVYWLPSLLVLLHFIVLISVNSFLQMAQLYGGIILFVSLGLSIRARRPWLFPFVAFMHYYVVMAYGIGLLWERIKYKR